MKRVCHFGIFDPNHWRSRILVRSLERAGYKVVACRINPREIKGWRKYLYLYRKYKALKTSFDFVFVGFPGYLSVIVARLVSPSPIIFDAYISYFDSVRDRRDYRLYHPKMWLAWCVDFIDGLCSDVVLTINKAYRDFFVQRLKVSKVKVEVWHKGADDSVFYPREKKSRSGNGKITVGWWGSFIPLHGLPTIVDAANLLESNNVINFRIIGGGQLLTKIKKIVEEYNLLNLDLEPFIPQSELVGRIAALDITLGIFAKTPKAGRCVTNKVYEAMAMGKPIVTQDSNANKEIFTHKVDAYLVPAGDAPALASAITELAIDDNLRERLAKNASKLFQERFVSKKIEEEFIDIIKRHA